jgi:phosphatidylinositol alpha-1,6-mannosyltransferase
MKVLLLTQSFPPPSEAGSVQYLFRIFSALPPQSAMIVTGNAEPARSKEFDRNFPQRIIRFPFIAHVVTGHRRSKFARACEYLLWPLVAAWTIVRERPDVVHIGEFNVASVTALLAKKFVRLPYVLFTHAEEITYITTRPLYLRLLKAVLRNADAIITVSEYTRGVLHELGAAPESIHKVLPPVGESNRAPVDSAALDALRANYSIGKNRVLLTVGRLVNRKGHTSVIEALPFILESFPETLYVIVGTGPEEQRLKDLVLRAGLQDRILFTGRVDESELACWYEICDIMVMPNRYLSETRDTEGCGIVFLEASAHGKPVIGGRDGGVADAILDGRTGFTIDGTDAAMLAEKVCYLLGNPEAALEMGRAGRAYVSTLRPECSAAAIQRINEEVVRAASARSRS